MPEPERGLVVRYSYLWHSEAQRGQEEGVKERPCAIVIAVKRAKDGKHRVMVAPITHTLPEKKGNAVEVPPAIGRALGFDHAKSWIVTTEVNVFTWPGPDIRAARGKKYEFGRLPHSLAEQVRRDIFERARTRAKAVERDEK